MVNSRKADWPAYKLEDKAWFVLKARNSGPHALYKQKESECKMWRSIRDIEYQYYEAKFLSGMRLAVIFSDFDTVARVVSGAAIITSFQLRTLLTIAAIGYLLVRLMICA